jgi:alpha-D-ribose 1-methylphosphonate 5-triphosphate synthase subunit PhnL
MPASIFIRQGDGVVDVVAAPPRQIPRAAGTLGYVSQFLRAVPRVAALDVVAEPLVLAGVPRAQAQQEAADLLHRLNIPDRLRPLPPATFSAESSSVNIARGFLSDLPLLLLDEPTASLDPGNAAVVIDLIAEKKRRGVAIVAIVHDDGVRTAIADTVIDVTRFTAAA